MRSRGPCKPQREWTERRVARLGFLVGLGWDGWEIANDKELFPDIAASKTNLYRQAGRFGLSFHKAAQLLKETKMSEITTKPFDAAAIARGIPRSELIRRLMLEISCEPVLIDNILDDGAA
jgi:hypothetical protein